MNSSVHLLDRFQQFASDHRAQFDPLIAQIHQRLDAELALLQQQEIAAVQAQDQALQELWQAIGTDARFLLATEQFQSLVENLQPKKPSPYYSQPDVRVGDRVDNWLLCRKTESIGVSNYQEDVNDDDYDDERTYTSYSYGVNIHWGDRTLDLAEIQTERIYGPADHRIYGAADQREDLSDRLNDFYEWNKQTEEERILVEEMSYLVYYCCTLLQLQPYKVQLVYDSTKTAD